MGGWWGRGVGVGPHLDRPYDIPLIHSLHLWWSQHHLPSSSSDGITQQYIYTEMDDFDDLMDISKEKELGLPGIPAKTLLRWGTCISIVSNSKLLCNWVAVARTSHAPLTVAVKDTHRGRFDFILLKPLTLTCTKTFCFRRDVVHHTWNYTILTPSIGRPTSQNIYVSVTCINVIYGDKTHK